MPDTTLDNFDLTNEEFNPDAIDDPIEPLNIVTERQNRHRDEETHDSYSTGQKEEGAPRGQEKPRTRMPEATHQDQRTRNRNTTETRQAVNTTTERQQRSAQNKPSDRTKAADRDNQLDFSVDLSFFKDGRFTMLVGILLLFTALYFLIVTISFFKTGSFDQSLLTGTTDSINPESVKNTGGILGALLANTFMSRWLGVGSFILIAYITCLGLTFVRAKKFNVLTLTIKSLVSATALSIVAGYISLHFVSDFHWGGNHGLYINTMVGNLMGEFGMLLVNILLLAIMAVMFLHELTVAVKYAIKRYRSFRSSVKHENEMRAEREERMNNQTATAEEATDNDNLTETPSEPVSHQDETAEADTVRPITQEEIHRPIVIDEERLPKQERKLERQLENVAEENVSEPARDFIVDDSDADVAVTTRTDYNEPETATMPATDEIRLPQTDTRSDEPAINPADPSAPTTTKPVAELTEIDDYEPESPEAADIITEPAAQEATATFQKAPEIEVSDNVSRTAYDPTAELSRFRFPSLELLHKRESDDQSIDIAHQEENKQRITNTLNNFGIGISHISATIGPTVTLYEIVPADGVRISKIKNLEDDIARSIAAKGTRIIAPIPGKETIGIEVPNMKPQVVPIRTILSSKAYQECDMELPMAMGATIDNKVYIADLCKMPHLLVAGATGTGKSVGLNTIIASLLFKKHPTELKFVLVDPKQVEFSIYRKIENHYLAKIPGEDKAIITDLQKVVPTLNSLCIEMENRYSLLTDAYVRSITEYNRKFTARQLNPDKGHRYLPYIVVVVDEFADLIMTVGKEVEQPIARLAQKARAIGIHLILATQRPSTNVITGIIKANFPGRIAFRVFQMVDSRTILDRPGANQLIGRGDMLFSRDGVIDRVQCALIETDEVEAICDAIGDQVGFPEPYELPENFDDNADFSGSGSLNEFDPLFPDVARYVVTSGNASASSLQTRYTIGYPRARKIMEQLENAGVVGPANGSKPRQLLMDSLMVERLLESRNIN